MRNLIASQVSDVSQIQSYNDIIRYRLYFGAINTGTTSVIPAQDFFVFQKGQGQQDANISTGAAVSLQQCDVSLFNAQGIIPNASRFTAYGIAIDCPVASISATTPFQDNTVTAGGGAINVLPLAVANPYPFMDWLLYQCSFELWRNSYELLEQGNVSDYTSGLGVATQGSNGQASVPAVTTGPVQAAYTQNGFIQARNGTAFRPLTVAQVFEPNDQFYGKLIVNRSATLTGTGLVGHIDFLLIGEAEVDRKASQVLNPTLFPFNQSAAGLG